MIRIAFGLSMTAAVITFSSHVGAQCAGDAECKEGRVCQNGICTEPQTITPNVAAETPQRNFDPCAGIACSDHGTCVVKRDQPLCACAVGYIADSSNLNCLLVEPPVSPTQPAAGPMATTGSEPSATNASKRKRLKALGHASFWTGLSFAAFGGVATTMAKNYGDEYNQTAVSSNKENSRTWSGFMWGGFGAGLVLMTTGIALWASVPEEQTIEQNNVSFAPLITQDLFALSMKGEF